MENREDLDRNEPKKTFPKTTDYEIKIDNKDVNYEEASADDADEENNKKLHVSEDDKSSSRTPGDRVGGPRRNANPEFKNGKRGTEGSDTNDDNVGNIQPRAGLNSQGSTQNAGVSGTKNKQ